MSSRRFSYAPGTRLDWKCSRESVRGETFSRRNGGQNCRVGTFARRDRGQNSREGTFARRDGGQNSRDETFARGDLQGHRTVHQWESLYSPMLKYGSYRSRDLKLRHRERCVSL